MLKRKERKQPRKEFTEMDLPHNRFQAFWDLLKHRSRFLLLLSFYNLMFALPLFLWNIFMNQAIWGLIGETEKNIGTILSYVCTKDAVSVVCSMLLGFPIAGSLKIIQKLAWQEMAFPSDFWKGLRENGWKDMFSMMAIGLSYWLVECCYYCMLMDAVDEYMSATVFAISVILLSFVSVWMLFNMIQTNFYKLNFAQKMKNGFFLALKSFMPMLGIILCFFAAPIVFWCLNALLYEIIADALITVLFAYFLLAAFLCANWKFDQLINREQFPDIVDKGIVRIKNK